MTQNLTRIQRDYAEWQRIRRAVKRLELTKMCTVCNAAPAYEIRPGIHSMTCARVQCGRAWLLGEPWRCEYCRSLDFRRLDMQWDSAGRKLYRCGDCKRTYAVHHRAVVTDAEIVEGEETE